MVLWEQAIHAWPITAPTAAHHDLSPAAQRYSRRQRRRPFINREETLYLPSWYCRLHRMQAQDVPMSPVIRTLLHLFRALPPTLAVLAAYGVLLARPDGEGRRRSTLSARHPLWPRSVLARWMSVLCALALALAADSAHAAGRESAITQVKTLSSALLESMRAG